MVLYGVYCTCHPNGKIDMRKETIRETFNEWNDWRLENNRIEKSTHMRNIRCFERHYISFGRRRLEDLSGQDIVFFLEDQIYEHSLTAKAFSNLKSITKGFLKRAKRRGIIDWNVDYILSDLEISDKDFKKVVKEDYEEVFNEVETEQMFNYISENKDPKNLAILLMFVTGMRIGEVVALKKEDLGDKFIRVRRTETFWHDGQQFIYEVKDSPKTAAGFRTVVLPRKYEWLTMELMLLDPGSDWVFTRNGDRMKECMVKKRLDVLCKKLGIHHKSPHKIRKTYVSMLLDSNVDDRFLMDQVGHASISVSERNYHRNRKTINKKQDILETVLEFA